MRLSPQDVELGNKILDVVPVGDKTNLILSDLQADLKKHQLSRSDTFQVLSDILHFSSRETNKIAVAKLALTLNGDLKDDQVQETQKPAINFIFNDSNVNLQGVFNPTRS